MPVLKVSLPFAELPDDLNVLVDEASEQASAHIEYDNYVSVVKESSKFDWTAMRIDACLLGASLAVGEAHVRLRAKVARMVLEHLITQSAADQLLSEFAAVIK